MILSVPDHPQKGIFGIASKLGGSFHVAQFNSCEHVVYLAGPTAGRLREPPECSLDQDGTRKDGCKKNGPHNGTTMEEGLHHEIVSEGHRIAEVSRLRI